MKDTTRCLVRPEPDTSGYRSLAPATHRASTIVFRTAEDYARRGERGLDGYSYGLYGTPTTRELCETLADLAGASRCLLSPSGQGANALAVMALLSAGDHVLIPDSVYPAMRALADIDMARAGIAADYYDPLSLDDLESRIRPQTRMIWCESPGSTTMEVQDLAGTVRIARAAGALTGCDNTWATSLRLKPHGLGVDIVTEALTKYAGGHSDLLMGATTFASDDLAARVRDYMGRLGIGVSPDDAALVLRGMETMPLRLSHAEATAGILVARLLESPAVSRVLWPPLADSPGHAHWKREFTGGSGVFSLILADGCAARLDAALDGLKTFAIGASWGGTRSLIAPMRLGAGRTVRPWQGEDLILRVSVGLEDIDDLVADLNAFTKRLTGEA